MLSLFFPSLTLLRFYTAHIFHCMYHHLLYSDKRDILNDIVCLLDTVVSDEASRAAAVSATAQQSTPKQEISQAGAL